MDRDEVLARLEAANIAFVRFVWCDNGGVIRAKAAHRDALARHLDHGIGITLAQQAIPAVADFVAPGAGLAPVGEARLRPDWATLAPLPYAPGHARVFCDIWYQGRPWAHCPRHFLDRQLAALSAHGLEVRASFENEFYLLRGLDQPLDDTVFAATRGLDGACAVLDDLAAALIAQGLAVELCHAESGPGQFEMSVREAPGRAPAERQITFRETAHAVAARHGLRASFLPKLFADQAGSGCHLHFSLWKDGANVSGDAGQPEKLSTLMRGFVGGLISHLPALLALTAPSPNSYRRLCPQSWSGAFRCWGVDNREAAVRVPSAADGGPVSHVELKASDATANPFLSLGAVLAAGLDGLGSLDDPGVPLEVDPGTLSEAERKHRGIDALPADLGEAIGQLEKDEALLAALGPELAQSFLAVRRAEWQAMQGLDLRDEVAKLWGRY